MDSQERSLESAKLYYDYAKHQSTLSATTAVVLVALFREDTPWLALILLAVSAVLSLRAMEVWARTTTLTPETYSMRTGKNLVLIDFLSWVSWIAAIVWTVISVALVG